MTALKSLISQRLIEARRRRDMSQQELAAALNSTAATISRYENGGVVPPVAVLSRIARALGCSVGILVGETPWPDAEAADADSALDRARCAACIDALDFYCEDEGATIVPGGRSDLVFALYDYTVDSGLPTERIGDLTPIRALLRPALKRAGAAPSSAD